MSSVIGLFEAAFANDAGLVLLTIFALPGNISMVQWLQTHSHGPNVLINGGYGLSIWIQLF